MAVKIINQEDTEIQRSGSKTTITRVILYEADSMAELLSSGYIPVYRARHPNFTAYYLESARVTPVGNRNRGVQAKASLSYVAGSTTVTYTSDEDPWDLGAQDVTVNLIEMTVPLTTGWIYGSSTGTLKVGQNLNSAGCRILAETTKTIPVLNFTYSVKAKSSGSPNLNLTPIINEQAKTVAGVDIKQYAGKLMPMTATYVVEYDDDGDVKRKYWDYNVQIQIQDDSALTLVKRALGWARKELNVGTLCYFKDGNGNIIKKPRAIYRYTPWTSSDMDTNLKVEPVYGSLDDVIKANKEYREKAGDSTASIPYEEVTEPMPLNTDGTLFTEALQDPTNNPYNIIQIFDCEIGSWNSYNLPADRE